MNTELKNNTDNDKSKLEKMILDFIIEKNINDMDKICLLKELSDYIKRY